MPMKKITTTKHQLQIKWGCGQIKSRFSGQFCIISNDNDVLVIKQSCAKRRSWRSWTWLIQLQQPERHRQWAGQLSGVIGKRLRRIIQNYGQYIKNKLTNCNGFSVSERKGHKRIKHTSRLRQRWIFFVINLPEMFQLAPCWLVIR